MSDKPTVEELEKCIDFFEEIESRLEKYACLKLSKGNEYARSGYFEGLEFESGLVTINVDIGGWGDRELHEVYIDAEELLDIDAAIEKAEEELAEAREAKKWLDAQKAANAKRIAEAKEKAEYERLKAKFG